jgi:hypothetical protein
MLSDLTAILVPEGQWTDDEIRTMVRDRTPESRDVLIRVAPLTAARLLQVEVCDAATGIPCEDPELVAGLSRRGKAAYVHVNHEARQALVHSFSRGEAEEGYAGEPGDAFTHELEQRAGCDLATILAADDASRVGIGLSASRTQALVRGQLLVIPPGLPTGLNSFAFHDRGAGHDEDEGGERLALFAFDAREAERGFFHTPGRELAAQLTVAPRARLGPLYGARDEALAALVALGDGAPVVPSGGTVRAFELFTLAGARVFAGGEDAGYYDERFLPMFSLSAEAPVIEGGEVDELDACESVLHAMTEVLPYAAPPGGEGPLLASLGPDELVPLAVRLSVGSEYTGAVFRVRPERLRTMVDALDGERLTAQVSRFERAWYRAARPGLPEGDALDSFRRAKAEEGQADTGRFVTAWAELRALLEIAAANRLDLGVVFYG